MRSRKLLFTAILITAFLIGCYLYVFYAYKYNHLYAYTAYAIMFFSVITLAIMWLDKNSGLDRLGVLKNFIPVAFLLLTYYVLTKVGSSYLNDQLHKFGVVAKARVTALDETHGRSGTHYHAIIEYKVRGTSYLQSVNNDDNVYKGNDSLLLVCSSHDPEIFSVISKISTQNK